MSLPRLAYKRLQPPLCSDSFSSLSLLRTKNATCHVSKQRILRPSNLQPPLTVHPEGLQDREKQDTSPRKLGYTSKEFHEPRLLHLPIYRQALNLLTWDVWGCNFFFFSWHSEKTSCFELPYGEAHTAGTKDILQSIVLEELGLHLVAHKKLKWILLKSSLKMTEAPANTLTATYVPRFLTDRNSEKISTIF